MIFLSDFCIVHLYIQVIFQKESENVCQKTLLKYIIWIYDVSVIFERPIISFSKVFNNEYTKIYLSMLPKVKFKNNQCSIFIYWVCPNQKVISC